MQDDNKEGKKKIIGIDYGSKKVGVAISNPERTIAFPKTIIPNKGHKDLLERVKNIVKEEGADSIVLGWSLDQKGQENFIMKDIHAFANKMTKETDLPIFFESESMTTSEAALSGKKGNLDDSAAALILQGYLERTEEC